MIWWYGTQDKQVRQIIFSNERINGIAEEREIK